MEKSKGKENLIGQQFKRWKVLNKGTKKGYWVCKCDCGIIREVRGRQLKNSRSQSCGCLRVETFVKNNTKHGLSRTPTYALWQQMRQRCTNPKAAYYENYGGRGIQVCDRWSNSFNAFLEDMGEKPANHSLDRIDVNGNYEPHNCRWATSTEQARNTTRNISDRLDRSHLEAVINRYNAGISTKKIATEFRLTPNFVSGFIVGANLSNPIRRSYGFKEIALVPQKNICKSRLDTSTNSEVVRGLYLDIPFIAANMSSVCNPSFCAKLNELGSMGILHRATSNEQLILDTKELACSSEGVAVSIGIGEDQFDLVGRLVDVGANIIVIDIANGYTDQVIELGRKIKNEYKVKLVLGNTTSVQMLYEVDGFADAVKVGIAQGLACETKNTAAFTEGQFSAVLKFKTASRRLGLPIISDGGIREPGDLVKAIAAGANSAMAGSVFARCPESAGEVVTLENGTRKKLYAGMASRHVQNQWRGGLKDGTCPEGNVKYLDLGEPVEELLQRYTGALRSGITYSGGTTISELQDNAEFVQIASY